MTIIETMKAERERLVKDMDSLKANPAIAARIAELRAELTKLRSQLSGADVKRQIAVLDRAIKQMETPHVAKPMSEAGKAAIKAGLAKHHEAKKQDGNKSGQTSVPMIDKKVVK